MQNKKSSKKILLIAHSSGAAGGGEDDYLRLIKYMHERYRTVLVFPEGPRKNLYLEYADEHFIVPDGIFPFDGYKLRRYIKYFLISIIKAYYLIPYLLKVKAEVEVCFVNSSTCLVESILVHILGIPYVVSIKEVTSPESVRRMIYRFYGRTAASVIVISKMLKDIFDSCSRKKKSEIVYSSIDEIIYADQGRQRDDGPHDVFKIVNIGVIAPVKNQELLIRALMYEKTEKKTEAVFIGRVIDPAYEILLNGLAEKLPENVSVRFAHEMAKPDVVREMVSSDCTVITSKFEGMSLVFVESLFLGVPVISTKVGVVPEIIRNGENGFIVSSDDPSEMAEALSKLSSGEVNSGNITNNYMEEYGKYFNLERYLKEHERIILRSAEKS